MMETVQTQLYSIILYGIATISFLTVCLLFDRFNSKDPVLLACLGTSSIGHITLMITTDKVVLILEASLVALEICPASVLNAMWVNISHSGYTKRSTAWALAQIIGNSCGVVGTQVQRDPPRFLTSHGTLPSFMILAMVTILANCLWMKIANKKKRQSRWNWEVKGTRTQVGKRRMGKYLITTLTSSISCNFR